MKLTLLGYCNQKALREKHIISNMVYICKTLTYFALKPLLGLKAIPTTSISFAFGTNRFKKMICCKIKSCYFNYVFFFHLNNLINFMISKYSDAISWNWVK